MIFESFLNTIDLFGIPLTINFGGKEKSKSKLGGICSLIFIGLVLWVIFNSSKDLFSRKIPKTITSESYNESPRLMSISPSTFPLGFVIQAPDTLGYQAFVDESIYTLKVTHTQIERVKYENGTTDTIYTLTDVALERCTPEHLGELYASVAYLDLSFSHCIARNQPEIKIQGVYESLIYQGLDVQVNECNNLTSQTPCAPREILDEFLAGAWFNAAYANMAVDPKNYSRPDSKFRDIYYTMISPANYKYAEIELGHVQVQTDLGWLVESVDLKDYIKVNKITELLQFKPHPDKILMFCTFKVSKLEQTYLRSYKKIQDVLAEVGGLSNAFMMILMILTNHYLNLKVKESLMNELFDLNISQISNDKKSITKKYNLQPKSALEIRDRKSTLKRDTINIRFEEASSAKLGLKNHFLIPEADSKKICQTSSDCIDHKDLQSKPKNHDYLRGNVKQSFKEAKIEKGKEDFRTDTQAKKLEWQEERVSKAGAKESFRKMMSFEVLLSTPESPKNEVNEQESKVDNKKLKALKPKFKVLEDLEDENPEDPSSILDNFSSDENQVTKKSDFQDKNVKRNISKESYQKETDLEQKIQSKCFDGIKISQEKDEFVRIDHDPTRAQNYVPKTSDNELNVLNFTMWEYISSFFYQTKRSKKKWELLMEGINKTNERLDMLNLLKKLRDVDKLKALLMDYDQLLVFNNLPKPELSLNKPGARLKEEVSFSRTFLKKSTFIQKYGTKKELIDSFENIKNKIEKKDIDNKLLKLYQEPDL